MIRVEWKNTEGEEFWKNYPDIELTLEGRGHHAAYLANMFRDFMLTLGFVPDTVDEYIPEVTCIESHIENRTKEKFNEILEKSAKVSTESADNVTSPKNNTGSLAHFKPVEEWGIEDWRQEFRVWMKEEKAWDAYENVKEKNNSLGEISKEAGFLDDAFYWDEHVEDLSEDAWSVLDISWQEHIKKLKGET